MRSIWLLLLLVGCAPSQPAATSFVPGVPTDHLNVAAVVQSQYPPSFQDASGLTEEQSEANISRNVRIWGPGLDLNPGPQLVGDCTSWGGAHVIEALLWKASGGRENRRVSTLFLYALARRDGGFRLRLPCQSDGGYPSYLAHNFEQYGFLFEGEAGTPRYSASAAKHAGCNAPTQEQLRIARQRAGGRTQPLMDTKAWRNSLCGGYPPTLAFPWKPGKPYVKDGRVCIPFNGRNLGGHQICSLGYDGSSGKPYWFIYNSHGSAWPNGAPKPMQGEPLGGVWVEKQWAEWIIQNGELWAYSEVPGFIAEPLDLSIFDAIRAEGDDAK